MKARRRVVTSSGAAGRSARPTGSPRPKRTPTVRRIKPAIMPVEVMRSHGLAAAAAEGRSAAPATAAPVPTEPSEVREVDVVVDLGRGLVLRNPLIAASGPFGYGVEVADLVDLARIGALVTRTTTLRPSAGNSSVRPRIIAVAGGIVSGVGLQNPGIEAVLERYAATWARWKVPVILSIAGDSLGDVAALVNNLEGEPGIAGLELNILQSETAPTYVAAVRRASDLPIIAKLGPDVRDLRAVARGVADAGADAISAINAVPASVLAPDRTALAFGSAGGGLSGPAIRPIGLRIVFELAQAVDVPIIGIGGVTNLGHVLDYLAAGASAVGVATAGLAEPDLPARLAAALTAHCRTMGIPSVAKLVGTARHRRQRQGR